MREAAITHQAHLAKRYGLVDVSDRDSKKTLKSFMKLQGVRPAAQTRTDMSLDRFAGYNAENGCVIDL